MVSHLPHKMHIQKHLPLRRRTRGKGSALVEFVMATGFFIVPLLVGIMVIGQNLILANLVTLVCRDAAHMYAYGVDFSQTGNQNLLIQVAQGINMTTTGGNGVVILSTVTYVASTDCTAAGYQANTTSCPNMNQTVFIRRIVIGNSSLTSSAYGTPNSSILNSDGTISTANYLTDPSAQAANFSSLITLASGQYAYMAEMYVSSFNSSGVYSRSIF
jgi:hypothetical protein